MRLLLLQFHPSILEPDFYLPLREAKFVGNFDSSLPRQVLVVVELLFEFESLKPGVRLTGSLISAGFARI